MVLITGGYGSADTGHTAELFLPASGLSCSLPSLPGSRNSHSIENTGLLCGGRSTEDTCIQWSPDTGTWEGYITLDTERDGHDSWTPENGIGTYLIGGYHGDRQSTTLVKPDGTQEPGFRLKYDTL